MGQLLINNAGMYGRRLGLLELEASDFNAAFTTNALGPFLVTQQLLKQGLIGQPGTLVVRPHAPHALKWAVGCVMPRMRFLAPRTICLTCTAGRSLLRMPLTWQRQRGVHACVRAGEHWLHRGQLRRHDRQRDY